VQLLSVRGVEFLHSETPWTGRKPLTGQGTPSCWQLAASS